MTKTNRALRAAALAAALSLATGCYSVGLRTGARPDGRHSVTQTSWHFIYGLTGANVSAPECRYGVASVNSQLPWWSIVVMGVSAGLVASSTTEYECAEGPQATQQPVAAAEAGEGRAVYAAQRAPVGRSGVNPGMKERDVQLTWGDPCETKSTTTAEGREDRWVYCNVCPQTKALINAFTRNRNDPNQHYCDGERMVTFVDGAVVRVDE
jgi:hypothetical protein